MSKHLSILLTSLLLISISTCNTTEDDSQCCEGSTKLPQQPDENDLRCGKNALVSRTAVRVAYQFCHCLYCAVPINDSVEWRFKKSGFDSFTSWPENAFFFNKTGYSYLHLCSVNKHDNEGTYVCQSTTSLREYCRPFIKITTKIDMHHHEYDRFALKCPYDWCVKKYRWYFKQSNSKRYEELSSNDSCTKRESLHKIRFHNPTQSCSGSYRCVADSGRGNFSSDYTVQLTVYKEPGVSLSCPAGPIYAVIGQSTSFTCNATLGDPSMQHKFQIVCTPSSQQAPKVLTLKRLFEYQEVNCTNRTKGLEIRCSTPEQDAVRFTINLLKFESKDEGLKCNLSFTDHVDTETKELTFLKKEFPISMKYIAIVTIFIVPLFLFIVFLRFEYEIRFLARKLDHQLRRQDKTAVYTDRQFHIAVVHSQIHLDMAETIRRRLTTRLPSVECLLLDDGMFGADRGDESYKILKDSGLAIILIESAAFGQRPALFERAVEQCLHQCHMEHVYIVLGERLHFPESTNFNVVMRKRIVIDLLLFSERTRSVRWRTNDVDESKMDSLVKRLRLHMPMWATTILPEAHRAHHNIGGTGTRTGDLEMCVRQNPLS